MLSSHKTDTLMLPLLCGNSSAWWLQGDICCSVAILIRSSACPMWARTQGELRKRCVMASSAGCVDIKVRAELISILPYLDGLKICRGCELICYQRIKGFIFPGSCCESEVSLLLVLRGTILISHCTQKELQYQKYSREC